MLKYVISVVVFAVMVSAQTNTWWPFSYSTCNFGTGGLGAQIDHMHIAAVWTQEIMDKITLLKDFFLKYCLSLLLSQSITQEWAALKLKPDWSVPWLAELTPP